MAQESRARVFLCVCVCVCVPDELDQDPGASLLNKLHSLVKSCSKATLTVLPDLLCAFRALAPIQHSTFPATPPQHAHSTREEVVLTVAQPLMFIER